MFLVRWSKEHKRPHWCPGLILLVPLHGSCVSCWKDVVCQPLPACSMWLLQNFFSILYWPWFYFVQSYKTFALSQTLGVYPDPLVSVSPLIQHSPNISTFRVSLQDHQSEFITVQDYTNRSVLHGFAEVGGLWTFLGGVFAAIFGSSLVQILYGTNLRFNSHLTLLTMTF